MPINENRSFSTRGGDGEENETSSLLRRQTSKQCSVFSRTQKKFIIAVAALAGTFSPLSGNIYYPAMNSIGRDLNIDVSLINLTITYYMIFQGLAPTVAGSVSDSFGRRPVYLVCFSIFIVANIGLALQNSFLSLLILRSVQSTGISGTIVLSSAVTADVIDSSERGMYMVITAMGSILGPSIGPVLGGFLSQWKGWRAVFWFLVIFSSIFIIPFALFFPETSPKILGSGSLPWMNKSVYAYFKHQSQDEQDDEQSNSVPNLSTRSFWAQLPSPATTTKLLFQLPTGLVLLSNGILYASYCAVTSAMPLLFARVYQLNDFQIGLAYIPIGLGTMVAAWVVGYLVDANYGRIAKLEGLKEGTHRARSTARFPTERARLQVALPIIFAGALVIGLFGWLIEVAPNIRVSLVLLFCIGFTITGSYNVLNILLVDLNDSKAGTVTAANNLVRCSLGAGATASINPLIGLVACRWAYFVVSAGVMLALLILFVTCQHGMSWRTAKVDEDLIREV